MTHQYHLAVNFWWGLIVDATAVGGGGGGAAAADRIAGGGGFVHAPVPDTSKADEVRRRLEDTWRPPPHPTPPPPRRHRSHLDEWPHLVNATWLWPKELAARRWTINNPQLRVAVDDTRRLQTRGSGTERGGMVGEIEGYLWMPRRSANVRGEAAAAAGGGGASERSRYHTFTSKASLLPAAKKNMVWYLGIFFSASAKYVCAQIHSQVTINSTRDRGSQKSLLSCTHALKYYVTSV